jgi:hypothetical protein
MEGLPSASFCWEFGRSDKGLLRGRSPQEPEPTMQPSNKQKAIPAQTKNKQTFFTAPIPSSVTDLFFIISVVFTPVGPKIF